MGLIETVAGLAIPQAALPLRLVSAARGAATWLLAHPMTGVAVLALAFGAVEHHEADKWAALARQRAVAIAAIHSANARAIAQATAAKEARDAQNAKLAVHSDQAAADLRGRYHAVVVQLAAAQSRDRSPDLPRDAATAARGDGPGESAGVSAGAEPVVDNALTISRDDALSCADNTARLQAVHDWATALGH